MDRRDRIVIIVLFIVLTLFVLTVKATFDNLADYSLVNDTICKYVPLEKGYYNVQVYTNGTCVFALDNLDENHSQQPDVKVNTHHNGEGEVAGEVYKPVGVRRGGITQYPSADTNDLCECGYNKWEHNQGLSYCSCKKFVKQNKEVSK